MRRTPAERTKYSAPNGSNANPGDTVPLKLQKKLGTMGRWAADASQPMRLRVPPGTVVRRKRGAVLLADLERVVRSPLCRPVFPPAEMLGR